MKIIAFCRSVYRPGIHLYFSLNWYFAFLSIIGFNHGLLFEFKSNVLIPVFTLFLALLYLRIVDEIKDFDYDVKFNPNRPLVTGMITKKELHVFLFLISIIFFSLNLRSGFVVLLILLLETIYSYSLIFLEQFSIKIRHNIIFNLIFTYPVNILLSFYLLFFQMNEWSYSPTSLDYFTVAGFAFAFLNYEFCRKIKWPDQEVFGERTYSAYLGTIPSKIISDLLGILSLLVIAGVSNSWLPIIGVLPLVWGWTLLLQKKSPTLSGSAFIGFFYGICMSIGILNFFNFRFHFLIWP